MWASAILFITNIWLAPLSMFLVNKLNLLITLFINVIVGLIAGLFLSESSVWLLNPYSWSMRAMVKILHIRPNGIPVDSNDFLVSTTNFWPACVLSLALFVLLTIIDVKFMQKKEAL